jgi:hypothetical protein
VAWPAVVVDAGALLVVDGSVTMVGPGRAVVVEDDLPITRPRCDEPPPEQATLVRATAARTAEMPVLRMPEDCLMGKCRPFPRTGRMTGMAYTSARQPQGVHW